ncbi:hypothetical protein Aduo_004831 [Ancylostoma duodenale]
MMSPFQWIKDQLLISCLGFELILNRKVSVFNPLKRRHQLLRLRTNPEQNAAAVASKRKRLKLQPRIIPLEEIENRQVVSKVEIPRPAGSGTQNQAPLPRCSPTKQPYISSSPLKPPVTNPREKNRSRCFRDLLKLEDFIPPRRIVPPPKTGSYA